MLSCSQIEPRSAQTTPSAPVQVGADVSATTSTGTFAGAACNGSLDREPRLPDPPLTWVATDAVRAAAALWLERTVAANTGEASDTSAVGSAEVPEVGACNPSSRIVTMKAMRALHVGPKSPFAYRADAAGAPTGVSCTQLEPCIVHTAPSGPIHVGAAVGSGADAFPEDVRFSKDGAGVACIGAQDPPVCARPQLKPMEQDAARGGTYRNL